MEGLKRISLEQKPRNCVVVRPSVHGGIETHRHFLQTNSSVVRPSVHGGIETFDQIHSRLFSKVVRPSVRGGIETHREAVSRTRRSVGIMEGMKLSNLGAPNSDSAFHPNLPLVPFHEGIQAHREAVSRTRRSVDNVVGMECTMGSKA